MRNILITTALLIGPFTIVAVLGQGKPLIRNARVSPLNVRVPAIAEPSFEPPHAPEVAALGRDVAAVGNGLQEPVRLVVPADEVHRPPKRRPAREEVGEVAQVAVFGRDRGALEIPLVAMRLEVSHL